MTSVGEEEKKLHRRLYCGDVVFRFEPSYYGGEPRITISSFGQNCYFHADVAEPAIVEYAKKLINETPDEQYPRTIIAALKLFVHNGIEYTNGGMGEIHPY